MGHVSRQFQEEAAPAQPEGSQRLSQQAFVAQVEAFACSPKSKKRALGLSDWNEADAEDLLQETVYAALKGGYNPEIESVDAWMGTIMVRCMLRNRNSSSHKRIRLFAEMPEEADPGDGHLWRDDLAETMQALERLEPEQRQALLARGEGLKTSEIAELFGATKDQVINHLSRGRLRLRELTSPRPPGMS